MAQPGLLAAPGSPPPALDCRPHRAAMPGCRSAPDARGAAQTHICSRRVASVVGSGLLLAVFGGPTLPGRWRKLARAPGGTLGEGAASAGAWHGFLPPPQPRGSTPAP